jgi:hypothetical protein
MSEFWLGFAVGYNVMFAIAIIGMLVIYSAVVEKRDGE